MLWKAQMPVLTFGEPSREDMSEGATKGLLFSQIVNCVFMKDLPVDISKSLGLPVWHIAIARVYTR